MKILALVTARGGSKRILRKNIRLLGNRPLIAWSIEIAKEFGEVCDVLVSTDDSEIAEVAKKYGALVPWLRPLDLATDTAKSEDAALHALNWYENENGAVAGLLLLQPTSPFRSRNTVERGITLFQKHDRRPVVGVSPASSHPMLCVKIENHSVKKFVEGSGENLRSQDLPPAYVINGGFYLIAPKDLRNLKSFYINMVPLVVDDPKERLDIDTEWDWLIAEAVLSADSKIAKQFR